MMKTIAAMMMAVLASQAGAQSTQGRTSGQLAQEAADTSSRLNAARANGSVESSRLESARNLDKAMAAKVVEAAANTLGPRDPAEAAATRRADASMNAAMKNVSSAGRILLAQSDARGATTAPDRPSSAAVDAPSGGTGPKPAPLKPVSIENPGVPGSKIIITCTGAAFFDSETAIALFTDNVEVRHPQFFVSCDEFEVHMVKDEKPKDGKPAPAANTAGGKAKAKGKGVDPIKDPLSAPPTATPAAPGAASGGQMPSGESDIKFAIARGRMVTIEKLTENGEVQIGHAKHATYEGATGNITLRDFPQVQRGSNLQIATDPSTVMVLKQNGALDTKGPSRTEIIQQDKSKPTKLNSQPPPPVASPNAGATSPR